MATVAKSARKPPAKRGSRKGVPNKATAELKELILGALSDVGGKDYLAERALDPKTAAAFLGLIGKVLPMTVQGPNQDGSFTVHAPWLTKAVADRNR